MNNCYMLLNNLKKSASEEIFATDFYMNLKRFQFMVNDRFVMTSAILEDFLSSVPEYLVDLTEDENCLNNLFTIAEQSENNKVIVINPLDKEDVGIKFVFGLTGKLISISIFNDRVQLDLNSNAELVRFNMQEKSLQLVQLFKNYYSLNKKKKGYNEFETVVSVEKESVDRKIKCQSLLLG